MKNGRKHSNHNAVRHGIFAEIVLSGGSFRESADDYLRLVSMLRESIRPTNGFEETLVEKLAVLYLRLSRVYKADAEIAPKMLARVNEGLEDDHSAADKIWISREDEVVVVRKEPTPDLILRYETNLERQIVRTVDQLARLRELHGDMVECVQKPRELKGARDDGAAS